MPTTFLVITMVGSNTVVLPLELLDEIFRISASLSTQSCLTLCLVSSWVHGRVIPYLMNKVVIASLITADSFYEHLFLTRPRVGNLVNPALHIRDLWLPDSSSLPSNIFLASRNLRRAAIDVRTLYGLDAERPEDREFECDLSLTLRGKGKIRKFEHLMKAPYMMRRITHLHLVSTVSVSLLVHLPRLTHLAMTWSTGTFRTVAPLALALPTLEMLVFVVHSRAARPVREMAKGCTSLLRRKEGRVWFLETDKSKLREDWEYEGRGGPSLWDRAIRQTTNWEVSHCILRHFHVGFDHATRTQQRTGA